jgi:hypothetical protein
MNYETNTRSYQTEPTLGELLSTLSNQAGLLVRKEVELAQVEMSRKITRAARNAVTVGIGAVFGLGAFYALVAAAVIFLAQFMVAWLAAVIVGLLLALVAGLLIRTGIEKLKEIDPAPRQTIETMRENKEWLTQQI